MRKVHQFRFQMLAGWLVKNYPPRKALDVGGGKGLLAFLLNKNGWEARVLDPVDQALPYKYKDLELMRRVLLTEEEKKSVKRLTKNFEIEDAKDFDLLIGLHTHGSNMKIIEACAKYKKNFVLLPCCVIDEPIEKRAGVNWLESLVDYARDMGFEVGREKLGFVGQDMVIFSKRNGV